MGNGSWSGRAASASESNGKVKRNGYPSRAPSPAGRRSSPKLHPLLPSVCASVSFPWVLGKRMCWCRAVKEQCGPGESAARGSLGRARPRCLPSDPSVRGLHGEAGLPAVSGGGQRVQVGSAEPLSLRRPVAALNAEFSPALALPLCSPEG